MKRKHKNYSKPRRPFDKERIDEEKKIIKEFGLKNKREIWKAEAKINGFRERAKKLVSAEDKDKESFFEKLNNIGLNIKSIAEVLSLTKVDLLNRRLQSVVFKKGLANSPRDARQLITHKKVLVDGEAVNIPSYIVSVELEDKIKVKAKKEKKVEEPVEEKSEEKPESVEEVAEENKSEESKE